MAGCAVQRAHGRTAQRACEQQGHTGKQQVASWPRHAKQLHNWPRVLLLAWVTILTIPVAAIAVGAAAAPAAAAAATTAPAATTVPAAACGSWQPERAIGW